MVEYVANSDHYQLRLTSLLTNVDKDIIIELYQPLIGANASILYLNLLNQTRNADETDDGIYSINSLTSKMQISSSQFISARKLLEGVGLIKSYEKHDENDNRTYIFVLYAPKSPKDFFNDILFRGLLIQAVGEKEARRLSYKYTIDSKIPEEYKDITCSIMDVFKPDFNDKSFLTDFGNQIVGRKVGKVKTSFSFEKFFEYLENTSQIRRTAITQEDGKLIEKIAALYTLDERTMAYIISECYKPYEFPHLDQEEISKKAHNFIKVPTLQGEVKVRKPATISSNTSKAKLVNFMETATPAQYLSASQGNTKPASADLEILDSLTFQYNLPQGVVNAVVYYTLDKNKNILTRRYCEKIASSLLREGIETAQDALNYLYNVGSKRSATSYNNKKNSEPIEEDKPSRSQVKEEPEMSEEELKELIRSIKG